MLKLSLFLFVGIIVTLVVGIACDFKLIEILNELSYSDIYQIDSDSNIQYENHTVVLKIHQNNEDYLKQLFLNISNPRHPSYCKYLSRDEIGEITKNDNAFNVVSKYLQDHSKYVTVGRNTRFNEYISITATVNWLEMFLNTKFFAFISNDRRLIRCKSYSLPLELIGSVEYVFETIQFPIEIQPLHVEIAVDESATGNITPDILNDFYHISSNIGGYGSQAVYASASQYYSPQDLNTFQNNYEIPLQNVTVDIGGYVSDDQCIANSNNCAEANLDLQYMMAVSQQANTTFWYSDTFLNWILSMIDNDEPPLVFSISYGSNEPGVSQSTADSFNNAAMILGLQGVTILSSSGDDGAGGSVCKNNALQCGYNPHFPSSTPYITSIGATQGPETGSDEIVCSSSTGGLITSGGGFSGKFDALDFQQEAISTYFKTVSPAPVNGYNVLGRGYPDLSLVGHRFIVIIGNTIHYLSGTSASTPSVAGMVALVNSARIRDGKSSLGYLNQAIYLYGSQFTNDITSGDILCTSGTVCCPQGFYAAPGW